MEQEVTLLGIQFRNNPIAIDLEQGSIRREVGEHVVVDFVSALDDTVEWNKKDFLAKYDGIILGGSGEFDFDGGRDEKDPARAISYEILDRLSPFLQNVFSSGAPLIGICYGHQLIGAFSGVAVYADAGQKKTKTHEVHIVRGYENDPVFSDVPSTFTANYGHKDVLAAVPANADLIACNGDTCKISGLKYSNVAYTFQFHPELSLKDMRDRLAQSPGYLPEGVAFEKVFFATPDANKILRNFVKIVRQH